MPNYKRKRAPHQTGRGKNHSTNNERSFSDRTKARKVKHREAVKRAMFKRRKRAIADYWAGRLDDITAAFNAHNVPSLYR